MAMTEPTIDRNEMSFPDFNQNLLLTRKFNSIDIPGKHQFQTKTNLATTTEIFQVFIWSDRKN